MVEYFRRSVRVHRLAPAKPAFELPCIRLFHIFLLDRYSRVEYTMNEAVLMETSGELDPVSVHQRLSLYFFYEEYSVFFLHRLLQQF